MALELEAARLAAARRTDADLAALRAALLDLTADTALRSPADRAAATDAHHDLAAAITAGDGAAAVDATRRNVETPLLQLRGA